MAIQTSTTTLPWSWYTDPAVLKLEQERIFRRSWQYVGRQDEVAENGSFVATRVGDVPVVLVRGRGGHPPSVSERLPPPGLPRVRGIRASEQTLQCPYHAWTYGLDGKLVAAPRFSREAGIDSDELGLIPLQLETWGPLVFVNPDPTRHRSPSSSGACRSGSRPRASTSTPSASSQRAESELDAQLEDLGRELPRVLPLPDRPPRVLSPSSTSRRTRTCSRCTAADDPAQPAATRAARRLRPLGRGRARPVPSPLPRHRRSTSCPARPNLSIGPIVPLATERTYRFLDYFVAEDADEGWIEESLAFDAQVGAEDRVLVERVQAGVRSGVIEEGRLMPESEQLVAHFQSLVVEALA